ncbi:MAG: GAF domain-containing protein [Candidatus Solibacter sp.]
MADTAGAIGLTRCRSVKLEVLAGLARLAFALSLLGFALSAQPLTPLSELQARTGADQSPALAGQRVKVRGVVSARPFHFADANSLLAIQDAQAGAILRRLTADNVVDHYVPGDEIEAEGTIINWYGTAMVQPDSIRLLGSKPAPQPVEVPLTRLQSPRHLGQLVRTQGAIQEKPGYNGGGAVILLPGRPDLYRLFIPRAPGAPKANHDALRKGYTVVVTGVALQYSPTTPYNSGYELVVANVADIAAIDHPPAVPQPVIASGITVLLLVGLFLWSRERRLRSQRKRLRRTYKLGEEILGASSAATILKRISEALPGIVGVTGVHLFVYNRTGKTLDAIEEEGIEAESISLSSPPGGTPAGAVACFHYRTLLVIPDIDRSPFPVASKNGERSPKSLLFVPMMAQSEVIGVLELDQDDRTRDFTADEQALAQHLGNQIGVAIRLLEQRTVQEQLFRTEKMAAVGRLISGVVNELEMPLASIRNLAQRAMEKAPRGPAEREVSAIAAEAAKASGMVTRLVSYAAAEQAEARPVDINGLLRTLIDFREGDWKASGIRVHDLTSRETLNVLGSQGQLEQVFLNLFVHAEQSLAGAEQKSLAIRTSVLARRVLVEISYNAPAESRKPEDTAAVLGVTRSVIAGHGGEVRLIEKSNADPRFEVELPALIKERSGVTAPPLTVAAREPGRRLTALVIEPDEAARRQLLTLLSTHGFRVVPVDNSDTGLDLAQRMRFDAAFCSLHAPGLNWVELSERMHSRVGGFVLLSDGYDAELTADFEGDRQFVLAKPLQEKELERILPMLEPSSANVIPFKAGIA